jgi:PIN domain nuclease of toxin-antitoxin system
MTYLFDTNAWIRAIERPDELTSSANAVLLNPASAPFGLSAISIYEIGQKARKGKLGLAIPIDRWLSIALRPALVQVIPIDADIARGANDLPGNFHGDPADRLIVATARKFGLTILTSDRQIRDYTGAQTIW